MELGGLEPPTSWGCGVAKRGSDQDSGFVKPDPASGRRAFARTDAGISRKMPEDLGTGRRLVPNRGHSCRPRSPAAVLVPTGALRRLPNPSECSLSRKGAAQWTSDNRFLLRMEGEAPRSRRRLAGLHKLAADEAEISEVNRYGGQWHPSVGGIRHVTDSERRTAGTASRRPAPRFGPQRSEAATSSSRSIASCMPISIPVSRIASRTSLLGSCMRIVRVVRPSSSANVTVFRASPSGAPS